MMTANAQPDTRLHGRWLILAKVVWILLAMLTFSTLAFAVWVDHSFESVLSGWTPEAYQAALAQAGLSANTLNLYHLGMATLIRTIYIFLSAIIFWRRAEDRMAFFISTSLLTFSVTAVWVGATANTHPLLVRPLDLLQVLGQTGMLLILYIFPDGRFVPQWARWPTLSVLGLTILVRYNLQLRELMTTNSVLSWGFVLWFFASIPFQIYRYRRVSDLIQRQQMKWAIIGFAGFGLMGGGTWFVGASILPALFPSLEQPSATSLFYHFIRFQIQTVGNLAVPICFAIAILRYRLFEIDLIIRKTLQYSLLSGLLAVVYFGGVVVIQSIFTTLTGAQSPIALVASTLAIAALFLPLRRRVQAFIDQRFYRQKYDAQKVLAEFAATCRDETDLDKLTTRLVEVMQETMQPDGVIVWLKPTDKERGYKE